MAYTLDALEEALALRIEALDPTAYRHGTDEVWEETDLPLTSIPTDSVLDGHLAFSVSVESAPVVDDGNASQHFVSVLATVVVSFLYRLRSDDQKRDERIAKRAARDILGAVMVPSADWGSALPINIWEPKTLEAEFLPVNLTFRVQLDVSFP